MILFEADSIAIFVSPFIPGMYYQSIWKAALNTYLKSSRSYCHILHNLTKTHPVTHFDSAHDDLTVLLLLLLFQNWPIQLAISNKCGAIEIASGNRITLNYYWGFQIFIVILIVFLFFLYFLFFLFFIFFLFLKFFFLFNVFFLLNSSTSFFFFSFFSLFSFFAVFCSSASSFFSPLQLGDHLLPPPNPVLLHHWNPYLCSFS